MGSLHTHICICAGCYCSFPARRTKAKTKRQQVKSTVIFNTYQRAKDPGCPGPPDPRTPGPQWPLQLLHQSGGFLETNPTSEGKSCDRRKWAVMESRRFRRESVLGNRHSQTFPFLALTFVQNRAINMNTNGNTITIAIARRPSYGSHMCAVSHGISRAVQLEEARVWSSKECCYGFASLQNAKTKTKALTFIMNY